MSPKPKSVPAAEADVRVPSRRLLKQLSRFPKHTQSAVRQIAVEDARLADLAMSFPGLLFAMAVPRRGCDVQRTRQLVMMGAPLKAAADAAGVPMWVRGLPPEAFAHRLPPLPDSAKFRLEVANTLPRLRKNASAWLNAVAEAYAIAGEDVALWVAREYRDGRSFRGRRLRRVCLWAWFSSQSEVLPARRFMARTWSPAMGWTTASHWAAIWLEALELYCHLGEHTLVEPFAGQAVVLGYAFIPLDTAVAIDAEAVAMRTCIRAYGSDVAAGVCRLFSIRYEGARIATLEIGYGYLDPYPVILQLRGPDNANVDPLVWMAARRFVVAQGVLCPVPQRTENRLDAQAWMRWWRPYWLAKRLIPDWLPLQPPRDLYKL